jgi:hypothetical protein
MLISQVGEVPFESKVTGNVEQLPVAISLLGAPSKKPQLPMYHGILLTDDKTVIFSS